MMQLVHRFNPIVNCAWRMCSNIEPGWDWRNSISDMFFHEFCRCRLSVPSGRTTVTVDGKPASVCLEYLGPSLTGPVRMTACQSVCQTRIFSAGDGAGRLDYNPESGMFTLYTVY